MNYKEKLIQEIGKKERSEKQKIMITIPENLLCKLDYYAEERHMTRSGAIGEAVDIWTKTLEEIENYKERLK